MPCTERDHSEHSVHGHGCQQPGRPVLACERHHAAAIPDDNCEGAAAFRCRCRCCFPLSLLLLLSAVVVAAAAAAALDAAIAVVCVCGCPLLPHLPLLPCVGCVFLARLIF